MSYATLAPSAEERRYGVVGLFLRATFGRANTRANAEITAVPGAFPENELTDIGHARGILSGASQQSTPFR